MLGLQLAQGIGFDWGRRVILGERSAIGCVAVHADRTNQHDTRHSRAARRFGDGYHGCYVGLSVAAPRILIK